MFKTIMRRQSVQSCSSWKRFTIFLALVFLSGLACRPAWSQTETGSIGGTVTDTSGAIVPGANVTIKNSSTGVVRTAESGGDGQYLVQELIPGIYEVAIAKSGFKAFSAKAEVTVGGRVIVDAQLSMSEQTTTVEVHGAGGTAVNTQTQELSQLVDPTQMADLPSLNRNPYDFVELSGNISNGDITSNGGAPTENGASVGQSLTGYGVGYFINGQRATGTEILLDGVENVAIFSYVVGQPVPSNSVQEFTVITNNYGPEYGRASGGIVDVDSKHGTNDFHGDAYDFNRLSAYTSNTYANTIADLPKGKYTRNVFGYDVGVPIEKNKLFGFFSNEYTRVRSNAIESEDVIDPSFISLLPSNIQSYFSKFGTGLLPASTKITAGELAPSLPGGTFPLINGVTPVAATQPVLDTVNFPAAFDAGGSVPQNTYSLLGRVDYNLSDKTTMFARYARYNEDDAEGAVAYSPYPQYDVGAEVIDNSWLYSLTHIFNPNLLSTTKASFTRYNIQNSFNAALTDTPNLYLSNNTSAQASDPVTGLVIQLPGLENSYDGSGGLPFGGPQNTFQLSENVGWTRGRHSMNFGGEFTYIQLNVAYGAYFQAQEVLGGTSDFSGGMESLANAGGCRMPVCGQASSTGAFASPLFQFATRVNAEGALPCPLNNFGQEPSPVPASCAITPPLPAANPARSYRYGDGALYAGDSFRILPHLTLNYGLRWEYFGVQHNNHQNLDSNFYPGAGAYPANVADGAVFPTQTSPLGEFWKPHYDTFGPRVGFAWDIFGNGTTALRGGYGISYERNFGNVTYNASFNPPASAIVSPSCSSSGGVISNCNLFATNADLGPLGSPGPTTALPPVELRDDGAYNKVAQTQFWSLDLQREVLRNSIVDISYSGARGEHLYDLENINLIGTAQEYLGAPLVVNPACPYSNPSSPTGAATCYTRANQAYTNINLRGSLGDSQYEALNVAFKTNNLRNTGLSLVANYTYAHSLDDLSATFSNDITQGSLGYTNVTDPHLDYGNSDFDVRNRFVFSPIWQTPWFNSGRGWESQVLGGWQVSSVFTARSGLPFSIYDETDLLNFYSIPRLTPATPITDYHTGTPVNVNPAALNTPNGKNFFTALTVPPPEAGIEPLNPVLGLSDFGPYPKNMTGRGAFRGPGAWNDDLAIAKNFKLTERFNLQFRAEGFDVFNHHNYYVNGDFNYYTGPTTTGLNVTEQKGGLGSFAEGGNHDERRFGQFSLKLMF